MAYLSALLRRALFFLKFRGESSVIVVFVLAFAYCLHSFENNGRFENVGVQLSKLSNICA